MSNLNMNIGILNIEGVGEVVYHTDKRVGQCGDYHVEEITNDYGQHYFKAQYTPTHLFGQEVEAAPMFGYGATREIAIERLEKEIDEFNESLWI